MLIYPNDITISIALDNQMDMLYFIISFMFIFLFNFYSYNTGSVMKTQATRNKRLDASIDIIFFNDIVPHKKRQIRYINNDNKII
jgi:hypothetical protein